MEYCPICKELAFVKVRLGAVASLDCGHVTRVGAFVDTAGPARKGSGYTAPARDADPTMARPTVERRRKRDEEPAQFNAPRVVVEEIGPLTKKAMDEAARDGRAAAKTVNVAKTIKDLLKGGKP